VGHAACMEEGRCVYRILVGRPEGNRPLGTPWRTWEESMGRTGFCWLKIGAGGGLL
jgi:hypothetical protein